MENLTDREREVLREALRTYSGDRRGGADGRTLQGWDLAIARDLYFRFGIEARQEPTAPHSMVLGGVVHCTHDRALMESFAKALQPVGGNIQ